MFFFTLEMNMDEKNRNLSEEQIRSAINAKLIETGERERLVFFFQTALPDEFIDNIVLFFILRLKRMLQQKLIECGWRDQVKAYCRGI